MLSAASWRVSARSSWSRSSTSSRSRRFTLAELDEEEAKLGKLRRWHERIRARDLHGASGAAAAARVLGEAQRALARFSNAVFEHTQPMTFVLVALGAAVAVSVELLAALAIVLAVAVTRRWSDALIGAALATVACALLAAVLGAVLLAAVPLDALRITIGALLLLFGLEWLCKGTLRLGGRRVRSSSLAEYLEAQEQLHDMPLPAVARPDWAGRLVAFKGVLLEGVEVVLIVSALADRPSGPAPALLGAALAAVAVLSAGSWLRRPLTRLPETELKWGVGVLLSAFGAFFAAEGLHVDGPGGDAAPLYVVAVLGIISRLQSHWLARQALTA